PTPFRRRRNEGEEPQVPRARTTRSLESAFRTRGLTPPRANPSTQGLVYPLGGIVGPESGNQGARASIVKERGHNNCGNCGFIIQTISRACDPGGGVRCGPSRGECRPDLR